MEWTETSRGTNKGSVGRLNAFLKQTRSKARMGIQKNINFGSTTLVCTTYVLSTSENLPLWGLGYQRCRYGKNSEKEDEKGKRNRKRKKEKGKKERIPVYTDSAAYGMYIP